MVRMLTMDKTRMKNKIMFKIKQYLKMILQNLVLPFVYNFWSFMYRNKEKNLIIFADAHHCQLPFSMEYIHEVLEKKGHCIIDVLYNTSQISQIKATWISIKFMKLYAKAKYIFICDNFLPVSSCKKSAKTKVIQLWHCCGIFKKMGYDTSEDIPAYYKGVVYKNYDLVTVSSPICVEPISKAMRLPKEVVQPIGVSRTDTYFDNTWHENCKKYFYDKYPNAKGKKVILWAPTFRGNATDPKLIGMDAIKSVEAKLGDEYYFIYKIHPHIDDRYHFSNCEIQTEYLFPVVDLLITDYSTVLIEFLFFEKPFVLFAPDLNEYEQKRGFYVDYNTLSPYIAVDEVDLVNDIHAALKDFPLDWIISLRSFHALSCDGHSTERIVEMLKL